MAEEEALSEAERLRFEQIRELDFEELQVEEVDADSDSDADSSPDLATGDESYGAGGFTYNTNLASLHTYLGEVEDTRHGLAFLGGGAVLTIPLFYLDGVVLFPEATLPLRVVQPNFISAIERALAQVDAPYTIGAVHVYQGRDYRRLRFATIGTTAEIRQYRRLEDGSLNLITRGKQRFLLRRHWIDVEGVPCGEVQIIQEDHPLRTPRDAFGKLEPLHNLRGCHFPPSDSHGYGDDYDSEGNSEESFESELSQPERRIHQSAIDSLYNYDVVYSTSSDDDKSALDLEVNFRRSNPDDTDCSGLSQLPNSGHMESSIVGNSIRFTPEKPSNRKGRPQRWKRMNLDHFRGCPRAFWPSWVYKMYDSYYLAQRAADLWKLIVGAPNMDDLVKKPDLLSFHIASKIPVSESTRQELLEIDGITYRLRREIDLLKSFDIVRCKNCRTVIARRSDMLVMSSDGPLGAYVNLHGFVHEIMTFYKANALALIGHAVSEYSWFPGYAWTITNCAVCETQMGWRFTATRKKLKPHSFWAIRSSQVSDDLR